MNSHFFPEILRRYYAMNVEGLDWIQVDLTLPEEYQDLHLVLGERLLEYLLDQKCSDLSFLNQEDRL